MNKIFYNSYALLIGVGKSAYKPLSLPVTVKDTKAIYATLINPNLCAYIDDKDHIRILNNGEATREGILGGLKWLKEKTEADPDETVLVYYSGHGWVDKTDNCYYLLQHDVKQAKLAKSALSAEVFTNALREINAERLLVVINSYHAAGMATSKDGEALLEEFDDFQPLAPSKGFIDTLKERKGRVVFTSCQGEQQSWIKDESSSIYTYHFLEALQGAGNKPKPGDTEVKVSNLMNYLGKTVSKTARNLYNAEQTPNFDFDTDDFAIALLRGGKGLPDLGWEEVKSEATQKINQIAEVVMENIRGKNIVGSIKGDNIKMGERTEAK